MSRACVIITQRPFRVSTMAYMCVVHARQLVFPLPHSDPLNTRHRQPQVILLREGTDTSQGKAQLISNINACTVVADAVRTTLARALPVTCIWASKLSARSGCTPVLDRPSSVCSGPTSEARLASDARPLPGPAGHGQAHLR